MFDKQDAGFKIMILANQNGRNPSIFLLVCPYEVFEIRCEVILLTAAQAEFTNRRDKSPKLSLTDNELGGSLAAVERSAGSSCLEWRIISQGVMDAEQTS
jgi:hypothetical protein